MKFNTDSHFVIGKSHVKQNRPCQDHALDRTLEGGKGAFIVVSDGCSSGSYKDKDNNKKVIHTDIGARVITCSAIKAGVPAYGGWDYGYGETSRFIRTAVLDNVITAKNTLGLRPDDMLATCTYAAIQESGGFVQFIGDGYMAIKYKDGSIAIAELDWQNNMPLYLSYTISPEIHDFVQAHKQVANGEKALKIRTAAIPNGSEIISFRDIGTTLDGYEAAFENLNDIQAIAIFSDGIADFRDERKDSRLPVELAIDEMMAFKNYTGEFVKRRMSAALKTLAKEEIYPNDDFSMAVIHINHDSTAQQHDSNT